MHWIGALFYLQMEKYKSKDDLCKSRNVALNWPHKWYVVQTPRWQGSMFSSFAVNLNYSMFAWKFNSQDESEYGNVSWAGLRKVAIKRSAQRYDWEVAIYYIFFCPLYLEIFLKLAGDNNFIFIGDFKWFWSNNPEIMTVFPNDPAAPKYSIPLEDAGYDPGTSASEVF